MSIELSRSGLAPGLLVGEGVEIGDGVQIGGNVVIHAGTRVGDKCLLEDNAVVGKMPRLAPTSTASTDHPPATTLGPGCSILAGAVVFAGAALEENVIIGDQSQVRERTSIAAEAVVGRGSAVDNDVSIGARTKLQANCYVTAYSALEDDVFVGPGVITTNDNTMSRHPREDGLEGVTLRRASRIGGGAVICPGVEVGEEAFVGAGAVVIADVESRAVVVGVPARRIREVPEEDLLERWR